MRSSRHILIIALALLASTGCSMVSGTRHADGRLTVTSWRLLWKSEAIRFTTNATTSTNPQPATFNLQLSIGQSASDDAAVAAVTEGAVKGVLSRP